MGANIGGSPKLGNNGGHLSKLKNLVDNRPKDTTLNRLKEQEQYIQEHRNEIILENNATEAARIVNNVLPHITVDGEEYIAAGDFNKYVKEHYPNAEFNEVVNYISLENAMKSITDYYVQQQTYNKSQEAEQLKKETGHDKAPDMGV